MTPIPGGRHRARAGTGAILKKYSGKLPRHAYHSVLSLPIAPLIPCHFIHWLEEKDALAWVESCGLADLEKERVYANKEVDWFAENLGDIYNLMLVTKPASSTSATSI